MLVCDTAADAQSADSLGIPDGTYTRTVTVGDIRQSGAEQRLKDIGFDFTGEPDSDGRDGHAGVRRRPGHQG